MRRRSTLFYHSSSDVDPKQITLSGKRLKIRESKAAREERLTLGFNELPQELWLLLRQSHELHIRWASELPYVGAPPLVSKIPPGLHVHFTPLGDHSGDLLCPLLCKVFSAQLKCVSPATTFTSPPLVSSRFASASFLHYHSLLPSLRDLATYIQHKLCPHSDLDCIQSASLLNAVDYLDIDYDSISHSLVFTAYWSAPPPVYLEPTTSETSYNSWTLIFNAHAEKVEVGVLSSEPTIDPYELQMSGFLTVVGEDERPAPTLFSFPSRHHPVPPKQALSQAYTVTFLRPTGLHPTMEILFPLAGSLSPPTTKPPDSICALHSYFALPSQIFADKYQLSSTDNLFLQSHNLRALRYIEGETDLEAPDYVIQKWGSSLLLELATPEPATPSPDIPWKVTVPLHLRYREQAPGGQRSIRVPWPVVFWACTAEEGTKFPVNPFDRVNLGYDAIFGPRTIFYHLDAQPGNGSLLETIQVPVLNTEAFGAKYVELGTMLSVWLGFIWILWKLSVGFRETTRLPGTVESKNEAVKKTQ